jgi:hypothetical protein
MPDLTTAVLSEQQARRICDKIKDRAEGLRKLLVELHDGKGWSALGYDTWAECCEKEFRYSKSYANRLIKAEAISEQVTPIGTTLTESQARELSKVPEEKRQAVLDSAAESVGDRPLTAKAIREAAVVHCPNCGSTEADDDGDCATCHEPDIEVEATPEDYEEIGASPTDDGNNPVDVIVETLDWLQKRHFSQPGQLPVFLARVENYVAAKRRETAR